MSLTGTNMPNYTFLARFKPQIQSYWAKKLKLHLTKSPNRDHKLCLYTLEEHKCLILTS